MSNAELRYGAFAPQGWKLEYTGWDAASAWERTKELAQLAEQLGYDHLWVYDHVETVPRREPTHMFEAFTMLAALAQHTSTIKLGQLVTCAAYRNAGLLAKEAACVDVFSGGRLILGHRRGLVRARVPGVRLPVPERGHAARDPRGDPRGHQAALDRGDRDVRGQALRVRRRLLRPEADPEAPPRSGSVVAARSHPAHRGAARRQDQLADRLEEFVHKSGCSRSTASEIGRDFDSIVRTHGPDCRLFDTEADLKKWLDSPGGGSLWGRGDRTTNTCATTSSAPSSR